MTPVQTPADLRPITALRFGAAIWVAIYTFWENLAGAGASDLVAKGYLGVELFFVLSGFILSHVYLQAAGEKRFSYRGFLWARVARVYPLHLFTLIGVGLLATVAMAAGMSVDPNVRNWSALPANLLMVHAWGLAPVAGWNHPVLVDFGGMVRLSVLPRCSPSSSGGCGRGRSRPPWAPPPSWSFSISGSSRSRASR